MIRDCDFQPMEGGRFKCSRCGVVRQRESRRNCSDRRPAPITLAWLSARRFVPWHDDDVGLGDFLARQLDSAGVTKARWLAFAKRIGAVPKEAKTCGCETRQAELNRRFPRP